MRARAEASAQTPFAPGGQAPVSSLQRPAGGTLTGSQFCASRTESARVPRDRPGSRALHLLMVAPRSRCRAAPVCRLRPLATAEGPSACSVNSRRAAGRNNDSPHRVPLRGTDPRPSGRANEHSAHQFPATVPADRRAVSVSRWDTPAARICAPGARRTWSMHSARQRASLMRADLSLFARPRGGCAQRLGDRQHTRRPGSRTLHLMVAPRSR